MSAPLVSVIIPVYNVAPYLREALDSVIHQTYRNLEIIVVDDGSSDGSGHICDQYQQKDPRIHVYHQENRGLSNARNTGLDHMHGEVVAFLDPDDALLPDMVDIMLRSMEKSKADIVVCGFYICRTEKRMHADAYESIYTMQTECVTSKTALQYLLQNKLRVFVWNRLYRARLFDTLRFPDGHVYEDSILTPFLFERADRIMMLRQPLLCYRKRPCSVTSTHTYQNELDWLHATKIKEAFVRKRTPSVFTFRQAKQFEESIIRSMIRRSLLLNAHHSASKVRELLEKEICSRRQYRPEWELKTEMLYQLYRHDPDLCRTSLRGYHLIRNMSQAVKNELFLPSVCHVPDPEQNRMQ